MKVNVNLDKMRIINFIASYSVTSFPMMPRLCIVIIPEGLERPYARNILCCYVNIRQFLLKYFCR
jgi:hypothetical protein